MKILLTNDDGAASPGIGLLAGALRKAGHRVFVLAPDSDRSGVSHAISFFIAPCKLTEIEEDTWSCSGTPVDCVVLALMGAIPDLDSRPELVISGINRGANLGTDILYSGTAAAARQAGLAGIPALALSLVEEDQWHWETAVSFAVPRLEEMRNFWRADTFVNVNFPNRAEPPSGLVQAFPARRR
jgi:5'-nucleotidase